MIGKLVALRAVEPGDADWIYRWENDPDVWLVSNTIAPFSRHVIEQYILTADQDIYAARQLRLMIDKKEGEGWVPAGAIDLFDFDPQHLRAGVGILVSGEHRGQGLATEALELLKSYAFETLHVHQLFAHIATDNDASLALFGKCGFTLSGTRREWIRVRNGWADEHILQCINPNQSNRF